MLPRLEARGLGLAYGDQPVVAGLDLAVPSARVTVIAGPNASGKSTLLRGLARLLAPRTGAVLLNGRAVHELPTREVARRLGILPQGPYAAEGMTVAELAARGRYPHRSFFGGLSATDMAAVASALERAGVADLAERRLEELSGGQRQRAWIAMVLAQDTPLLLLDEPITHLDLAHQVEVLELMAELNRTEGRTIVMVLHDLNLAARYADYLVLMRAGRIVAFGAPAEVVTEELIEAVFGLDCRVFPDPVSGAPMVVPLGRRPAVRPVTTGGDPC